jgi:protein SERAC1
MVYGYDSGLLDSHSFQDLEALGTDLRDHLLRLPEGQENSAPLILIGHSMGGLVIKQAINEMAWGHTQDSPEGKLLRSLGGILFFGVPHDGMETSSLVNMIDDLAPNRALLDVLDVEGSQVLRFLSRTFARTLSAMSSFAAIGQVEVFSFYETKMSPTAQKVDGHWQMTGPEAVLVTQASATLQLPTMMPGGTESQSALNRTHSDLVKFRPDDADYLRVAHRLQRIARGAFMHKGKHLHLYQSDLKSWRA